MIDKITITFKLFYLVLSLVLRDLKESGSIRRAAVNSTGSLVVKEDVTKFIVNKSNKNATIIPQSSSGLLLDDSLYWNFSQNEISLRSIVTNKGWLWPGGVVPYAIDSHFDWWQHEKIGKAVKLFHTVSCVRFVPRTNEKDYVFFKWDPTALCTSNVGKMGGMQAIALRDECITNPQYKGLLVHEMMHALGFMHEHQRSDRDCYLHVEGPLSGSTNFQIVTYTDTRFPYDYRSIMHYKARDWFYAKNGEQIGNRAGTMTNLDKDKLNYLYCGAPHYCDLNPSHCRATDLAERACRAKVQYKRHGKRG